MRICGSCPSSKMDMRRNRSMSPGYFVGHFLQEPGVDLLDDLQVPREKPAEKAHGPFFQCLGQKRVVGIGEDGLA